jgi:integrase/recombinase XerD
MSSEIIKFSRKGKKLGHAEILQKEQFKKVESLIKGKKNSKRNLAILYFAFELGLRACEITNLILDDVIEQDGKIKEMVRLTHTKGSEPRNICINKKNKKLRQTLVDHLEEYKNYLKKHRIPFNLNLPLFMSQKKGKFFWNTIVMILNNIFDYAGIKGARSHSGRITFITNKINQGYDIKTISKFVGHKSTRMTWHYYQTTPERLKKISEKSIF